MTKVLMISTDVKILEEGSLVRARMCEYGDIFGELHIIVMTRSDSSRLKLSNTTHVYSTASWSKFNSVSDAVRIGEEILNNLGEWTITTQDPFETGIVGLFLAKKFNAQLNVQVHTDFLSPYFVKNSILNRVRRLLARYVLPRATSIRVVSERIRHSLYNSKFITQNSNIIVLPMYTENNQSASTVSNRFPQFEKVILMTSRLTKEKDISSAIRAFVSISKIFTNIGLVIVGKGEEEVNLMRIVSASGVDDKVLFLGWRDGDDLKAIRESSDIFLSTSLYEGYGLAIVEAVYAGLPIVSTDAGIASELLSKERLATPGDVMSITTLLTEAIHHSDRFTISIASLSKIVHTSKSEYLKLLKSSLLL